MCSRIGSVWQNKGTSWDNKRNSTKQITSKSCSGGLPILSADQLFYMLPREIILDSQSCIPCVGSWESCRKWLYKIKRHPSGCFEKIYDVLHQFHVLGCFMEVWHAGAVVEEGRHEKGQEYRADWGQYDLHYHKLCFLFRHCMACIRVAKTLNTACCCNVQGLWIISGLLWYYSTKTPVFLITNI